MILCINFYCVWDWYYNFDAVSMFFKHNFWACITGRCEKTSRWTLVVCLQTTISGDLLLPRHRQSRTLSARLHATKSGGFL